MSRTSFDLTGRVALVTGASGGLGAHCAGVLAKAGAKVAVGARRRDRVAQVAGAIGGLAIDLDVTDDASAEAAFDTIESAWGAVDLLVNNAGVVEHGRDPLELSAAEFARVVEVNLTSVFRMSSLTARRLVRAGQPGAIVNIASLAGLDVLPGVPAYCASKAGVAHRTHALGRDLAKHGIRVNALAPGYISTDLNRAFLESEAGRRLVDRVPQGRLGQPADLDGPLLLLASEAGAHMTGVVLPVDGGHLWSGA